MSTIVTRSGKGSPLTNTEVDSNFSNLNTDKAELSGAAFTGAITTNSTIDGRDVAADGVTADAALPKSGGAMTGAITTNSTFDGRDVATDGTKLDGIEASATADQTGAQIKTAYEAQTNAFTDAQFTKLGGIEASATADQTAAEIRALVESATDSNVFTDADHTKLNGVEASADVTDTANVTAAGALMDSELTAIASVKALNQGVATGDSPTFAALTSTGEITANGGIALGDNDKATFGAGDDLQIYHTGSYSAIADVGTGAFYIGGADFVDIGNSTLSETSARFHVNDRVDLYHNNAIKLATTSTGIDVTGTATVDGLLVGGASNKSVQITSSTSNAGYFGVYQDSAGIFVNRDISDGSFADTGKTAAGIGIQSQNGNSFINFQTASTNNVEPTTRMHIDKNGNVGIACTPSQAKLDILLESNYSSHTGHGLSILSHANNAYTALYMGTDDTIDSAYIQSAGRNTSFTSKSLLLNPNGGNVGIGTSSPTSNTILHMKDTDTQIELESTNGSNSAFIDFDGTNFQLSTNRNMIDGAFSNTGKSAAGIFMASPSGGSHIAFATASANNTTPTERMRIDSSGTIISTKAGGVFLQNSSGGTSATQIMISNTGGSMRAGVESSSGGTIQTGTSAYAAVFGNQGNYPTQFTTNGNTRMTISPSGNVLVGTDSAGTQAAGGVAIVPTSDSLIRVGHANGTGSGSLYMQFSYNGSALGSISQHGTSQILFNTSSDYRLKENVVPMTGSIDRVKALKPSQFNFITDADKTVDGFLAHEAQAVVPECATGTKDAMRDEEYEVTAAVEEVRDEDDNITTEAVEAVMGTRSVPDMQGIDQSKLVPLLTAALQEAITKIESLEARLSALEE